MPDWSYLAGCISLVSLLDHRYLGMGRTGAGPIIMFISEMQKARSRMRLAIGTIVLAAAQGAVALWTPGAISNWVLTGIMVGAGLGAIVFAWVVGIGLRNRQRRRLMDMRDSALW